MAVAVGEEDAKAFFDLDLRLRELARGQTTTQSPLERYCPHTPTDRQSTFLDLPDREALYGGAAGGGKSDALLMAALQYVNVPNYAALLLRRTYADLSLPGAIMNRAEEWLMPTDAHWSDREKTWLFPSGATITFGYLEHEKDKYRYQSSEFQFVGFDELTQFREADYRYLFSRLRRTVATTIPLRMRAATNPGGEGHDWVKSRFIDEGSPATFIPAKLSDNPHVDREAYLENLAELDDVTRAQLEEGNWDVLPSGDLFRREWFEGRFVEEVDEPTIDIRYWDKAGTKDGGAYTAGVRMGRGERTGRFYVKHVVRGQWEAADREPTIRATAELDGVGVTVWTEQEPGSGGKESAQSTVRNLAGFSAYYEPVTGDKVARAGPLASQCKAGNVYIVRGPWNSAYLNELCAAPNGPYMDQVDGSSGAFNKLARRPNYDSF